MSAVDSFFVRWYLSCLPIAHFILRWFLSRLPAFGFCSFCILICAFAYPLYDDCASAFEERVNGVNGGWELFSFYATPTDVNGVAKQFLQKDLEFLVRHPDKLDSMGFYAAVVHMTRKESLLLTLDDEERLINMFRKALLYGTPWIVLVGTADKCQSQLNFLMHSEGMGQKLFTDAYISTLSSAQLQTVAQAFQHFLPSSSLESFLQDKHFVDAFNFAAELEEEEPLDITESRSVFRSKILNFDAGILGEEGLHDPISLGGSAQLQQLPRWVTHEKKVYLIPGVVTLSGPHAYYRMDHVAETLHTLFELRVAKRFVTNSTDFSSVRQQVLLLMERRDMFSNFNALFLQNLLFQSLDSKTVSVPLSTSDTSTPQESIRSTAVQKSLIRSVSVKGIFLDGRTALYPLDVLPRMWNVIVYHFRLTDFIGSKIPKELPWLAKVSHYLSALTANFQDGSPLLSAHFHTLDTLYRFQSGDIKFMDVVRYFWFL